MSTHKRTRILKQLNDILETTRYGLNMMESDTLELRQIGLRNFIVFGASLSTVLKQFKAIDDSFEDWYQPWRRRMKRRELQAFFYELDSKIKKQGKGSVKTQASSKFSTSLKDIPPKPPRADYFFINEYGESGWKIDIALGKTAEYYSYTPSPLPGIPLSTEFYFEEAPEHFKHLSAHELAKTHMSFLEELIDEAKKYFSSN